MALNANIMMLHFYTYIAIFYTYITFKMLYACDSEMMSVYDIT